MIAARHGSRGRLERDPRGLCAICNTWPLGQTELVTISHAKHLRIEDRNTGGALSNRANTILIVEDDPLLRFALQQSLEEAGYLVFVASDGANAVDQLDVLGSDVDALLTDIRLGDGPDGWYIARYARSIQNALPVIYITGDSQKDWDACGVEHSVLFEKPVFEETLLNELEQLL